MSILVERRQDGVAILRIDRPERRNALDSPSLAAFLAALGELAADAELRCLVLSTTSPRAFCAGADTGEALDREGGIARMRAFGDLYAALEAFPVPVVCVCVGNTLGAGAELAAGSDLRVGGENLQIGWVGARLGVPVGPARLVPLVGLARAKELIFTGRRLGARDALALGLVLDVVPEDSAEGVALELAAKVAELPPDGVRRLKGLFSELGGSEARVARENAELVDWQAHGAGLPQSRG
ncbi:MAG TPA: enoyl-CoA hydratase/isomerase family protein [Solirubrobacteraceae bacterium]|jgi:enoyl-CoA hydratase/carnithine racemase